MAYDEMSNFTHEELSHFTHAELSFEKAQLLYQILDNDDIEIPGYIIDKIYALCSRTVSELEHSDTIIPKEIKEILAKPCSKKLIKKVLTWLIKLLASSLISAGIKSVNVEEVNINYTKNTIQNTYYISSGELNDEVTRIIESIQSVTNIKIDFENITVTSE